MKHMLVVLTHYPCTHTRVKSRSVLRIDLVVYIEHPPLNSSMLAFVKPGLFQIG